MKKNNYVVYDKPYQLNIVGVRKNSIVPNKFDDLLFVFWKSDTDQWHGKWFTITTDPGTFWLKNPMHDRGTAMLKEGQYVDSYAVGKHRGLYDALVQIKPVTVFRNYDRLDTLDFMNGKEHKDATGINIHRANSDGKTKSIDKYSAGCQVFEDAEDFETFMSLANKHRKLYGNKFTYTLTDERAYKKSQRRKSVYIALAIISIGSIAAISHVLKSQN